MGIKLFKRLRRKRTTSSHTKDCNSNSAEKIENNVVTPQTSESTTEDDDTSCKLADNKTFSGITSTSPDSDSILASLQEEQLRRSDVMEKQQSGSGVDDTRSETTPHEIESALLGPPQLDVNDAVSPNLQSTKECNVG